MIFLVAALKEYSWKVSKSKGGEDKMVIPNVKMSHSHSFQ